MKGKLGVLVSGGGSLGSFGLAILEYLFGLRRYDLYMGWSVGALLVALASIGEFGMLKDIFFGVVQRDIFSVNPVNTNGGYRWWNAIKRTLQQKRTLGEVEGLKSIIENKFTIYHYNLIQSKGIEVVIAASDINDKNFKVKFFSSNTETFENFKRALLASASPAFLGNIVEIEGEEYTDPGLIGIASVNHAIIEKGCTHLDIIIHREQPKEDRYSTRIKSWIGYLGRVKDVALRTSETGSLYSNVELASFLGIKINTFFMPWKAPYNSFVFDPDDMQRLYYNTQKYLSTLTIETDD